MRHLVLLNGAPGVGKSTTADALAQQVGRMSVVDVDSIKHALPFWSTDPAEAGAAARRLALVEIERLLSEGFDVVLPQYLARSEFIEELEAVALRCGAAFVEVVLDLDASALAARLADRRATPSRQEHTVNTELVGPEDAGALVASLQALRRTRPTAIWLSAHNLDSTVAAVRALALSTRTCRTWCVRHWTLGFERVTGATPLAGLALVPSKEVGHAGQYVVGVVFAVRALKPTPNGAERLAQSPTRTRGAQQPQPAAKLRLALQPRLPGFGHETPVLIRPHLRHE